MLMKHIKTAYHAVRKVFGRRSKPSVVARTQAKRTARGGEHSEFTKTKKNAGNRWALAQKIRHQRKTGHGKAY